MKLAKIICGLFLTVVGFASAADVAPLTFKGVASASQQEYWDELMRYKLWGTTGITMGRSRVSDTNGVVGIADGNLVFENEHTYLGGPISVGGDIEFHGGGDSLQARYVRTTGDFTVAETHNVFEGIYCIEGVASKAMDKDIAEDFVYNGYQVGRLAQGTAAKKGMCAYDSVPAVQTYLSIPEMPALPTEGRVIKESLTTTSEKPVYLDVPPVSDAERLYDIYIDGSIIMEANSALYIRMKNSDRLVRIFMTGSIQASSDSKIQVVYVENGTFVEDKWTGENMEETFLENYQYAGNVLFYCQEDIDWPAMNSKASFQGTFMSAGQIKVGANLVLNGQLIANKLNVGSEFKMYYTPFDPPNNAPVLDLATDVKFAETETDMLVPIELSKVYYNNVKFSYCFDIEGEINTPEGYAAIRDFVITKKSKFPICGNLEYETATIKYGSAEPSDETKIYINVAKDGIQEGDEILKLKIFDLSGAVLEGGVHEGYINLTITDADDSPSPVFAKEVVGPYNVYENSPEGLLVNSFFIENASSSEDLVLSLVEFGSSATVSATDLFSVSLDATSDSVFAFLKVKDDALLDYESLPGSFHVSLVLKNKSGVELDTIIRTINIVDMNEIPAITGLQDMNEDYVAALFPFSLYPKENQANGDVIGIVNASDPDVKNVKAFGHLEYSIIDPDGSIPFVMDSNKIVVKDASALDYELVNVYSFNVEVVNCEWDVSNGTRLKGSLCLSSSRLVTVRIQDVNEPPFMETQEFDVPEEAKPGIVIDTLQAYDPDLDATLSFKIVDGDSNKFLLGARTGTLYLKDSLDYEIQKQHKLKVRVSDGEFFATTTVTINVIDVKESIKDTTAKDTTVADTSSRDTTVADTSIVGKKDSTKVDTSVVDKKDSAKVDTSATGEKNPVKDNPEEVDDPDDETDPKDSGRKDSDETKPNKSKTDSLVVVGRGIDSVAVPKAICDTLASLADKGIVLDENSTKNLKQTQVKPNEVNISYTDDVEGVSVTVSYVSRNGFAKKLNVVAADGKSEMITVMTVSYETEIGGRNVTVSFRANAETGEILVQDAAGTLMTRSAAQNKPNVGCYEVSYNYVDDAGNVKNAAYMVDENGAVVKNSRNGKNGDEIYAKPSFRIVVTGPFQFTIEMDETLPDRYSSEYVVMDLQGRVLRQGEIRSVETDVAMLRPGSYVVKVGLGMRRVNLH